MSQRNSTVVRRTENSPLNLILASLERELYNIKNNIRIRDSEEEPSLDEIFQAKEKMVAIAVNRISNIPGLLDIYNEEHANQILLDTLDNETEELNLISDFVVRDVYDVNEEIVSLNAKVLNNDTDDNLLADLRRAIIQAKSDFEVVLETLFPTQKSQIKTVLTILECASKKIKEEQIVSISDPEFFSALEVLNRIGIIQECGNNKFKLKKIV